MTPSLPVNKKIYIVDDDIEIIESLARFLERHDFQVYTFSSAKDYLHNLDQASIGCLVSDIDMPEMTGLQLQRKLNDLQCVKPTIFITGHGNVNMAVEAMKIGAFDFVEKPFDPDLLMAKINLAISEYQYKIQVLSHYQELTKKELEVCACVVKGMKNREISETLFMSVPTVEAHRSKVMKKMQANSLPELVKMLVLIDPNYQKM